MESPSINNKTILLTFDVEDWFQVENFKECISYSTWPFRELRVEKNTIQLLDILADAPCPVRATFFILGWIAERFPNLVAEIYQRGHEIASHGFNHQLCYNQTTDDLRQDLIKSKQILQDIIGQEVSGYRAPSFSITDEAISMLQEVGYLYDSSYNSYEGHARYGQLMQLRKEKRDLPCYSFSPSFYEIPVSNLRFGGKVFPWGGGGYFRLLPFFLHSIGVKQILRRTGCYTFYMHPWEIDLDQPRVNEAKPFFRYRHYVNLSTAKNKLERLLAQNAKHSFLTCRDFIKQWPAWK